METKTAAKAAAGYFVFSLLKKEPITSGLQPMAGTAAGYFVFSLLKKEPITSGLQPMAGTAAGYFGRNAE
jgi:hypothetical protein